MATSDGASPRASACPDGVTDSRLASIATPLGATTCTSAPVSEASETAPLSVKVTLKG